MWRSSIIKTPGMHAMQLFCRNSHEYCRYRVLPEVLLVKMTNAIDSADNDGQNVADLTA